MSTFDVYIFEKIYNKHSIFIDFYVCKEMCIKM